MRSRALLLVAVVAGLLLAGCGEPAADLDVPERATGQMVLDDAGLLDGSGVEQRLRQLADAGVDVVALTFETPDANLGEADRAGEALAGEWDAEMALVAVARPGDFHSDDRDARRRFFGLYAPDRHGVPGGLRERITEEVVPPHTADNDWVAAFEAAIDELATELTGDA